MNEELKNKDNNGLTDAEMNNVSGGHRRDFDIEKCPKCSAIVWVWRKNICKDGSFWETRYGKCEQCGYEIEW